MAAPVEAMHVMNEQHMHQLPAVDVQGVSPEDVVAGSHQLHDLPEQAHQLLASQANGPLLQAQAAQQALEHAMQLHGQATMESFAAANGLDMAEMTAQMLQQATVLQQQEQLQQQHLHQEQLQQEQLQQEHLQHEQLHEEVHAAGPGEPGKQRGGSRPRNPQPQSHESKMVSEAATEAAKKVVGNMQFEGQERLALKRTKGGRYLAEVSKEELLAFQHMPIEQAARQLGIGLTSLKIRCREVGIQKWPFRDIKRAVAQVAKHKIKEVAAQRTVDMAGAQLIPSPASQQQQAQVNPSPLTAAASQLHQHHQQQQQQQQQHQHHEALDAGAGQHSNTIQALLMSMIKPADRDSQQTALKASMASLISCSPDMLQRWLLQWHEAIAVMPPELRGLLQQYDIDVEAVVKQLQTQASSLVVASLQDAETRRFAQVGSGELQQGLSGQLGMDPTTASLQHLQQVYQQPSNHAMLQQTLQQAHEQQQHHHHMAMEALFAPTQGYGSGKDQMAVLQHHQQPPHVNLHNMQGGMLHMALQQLVEKQGGGGGHVGHHPDQGLGVMVQQQQQQQNQQVIAELLQQQQRRL